MPDQMFFSNDRKSLRRGKRIASRTSTCRPCLVWYEQDEKQVFHAVVMDISPYGFRLRMMDELAVYARVRVQLMRDEDFTVPLAAPILAEVVREVPSDEGVRDYGVKRIVEKIRPIIRVKQQGLTSTPRPQTKGRRLYAFDDVVNDWERQRKGRR